MFRNGASVPAESVESGALTPPKKYEGHIELRLRKIGTIRIVCFASTRGRFVPGVLLPSSVWDRKGVASGERPRENNDNEL